MSKYYVVSGDILPDVLEQVMQARILLQSGKAKRISEAVKMVGISRGTYYKYKDAVFSFNAEQSNRKAIISMILGNLLQQFYNIVDTYYGIKIEKWFK